MRRNIPKKKVFFFFSLFLCVCKLHSLFRHDAKKKITFYSYCIPKMRKHIKWTAWDVMYPSTNPHSHTVIRCQSEIVDLWLTDWTLKFTSGARSFIHISNNSLIMNLIPEHERILVVIFFLFTSSFYPHEYVHIRICKICKIMHKMCIVLCCAAFAFDVRNVRFTYSK